MIPATDEKAMNSELGNLAIDHRNLPNSTGGFYAYQSFVAPSTSSGTNHNEAFVGVSSDGGHTWTDRPIPCSVSTTSLNHNFPNVSVTPSGTLWSACLMTTTSTRRRQPTTARRGAAPSP